MPHEASPTIRNGVFRAGTLGEGSLVTTSAAVAVDLAADSGNLSPSFAAIAEWMQPFRSVRAATARCTAAIALAGCEIPEAGVLASGSFRT
jgi:hypothetical protein